MVPLLVNSIAIVLLLVTRAFADLRQNVTGIGIEAFFPGDEGYDSSRQAFNQRFVVHPAAIAFPASAEDVSELVKIGANNNVRVVARGGGHSYTANGLGGDDGALVIDMSRLNGISVDSETNIATIEAGNRLGNVASALNNIGRALPHGTCTYVGVGGHATYGGFGFTSRLWGLMTDTITAANVVLANGTLARIDAETYPDLFWAIRGAGPSFAIVTSFEFLTFPTPTYSVIYTYSWHLSISDASAALQKFQNFTLTSNVPPEMAAEINLSRGSERGFVSFTVAGAWYGSVADGGKALNESLVPLLKELPAPNGVGRQGNGTYIDTVVILANSDKGLDTSTPDGNDTFYAKSLMTPEGEPMNDQATTAFMRYLAEDGFDSETGWFMQVGLYGGNNSQINALPENATSFVRRDALFTMQFYASAPMNQPPYPEDGFTFLDGLVGNITTAMPLDWPFSAYSNYLDNRLEKWQHLYYGSHYPRLREIKRAVDPYDLFRYPNSVEL
ncbi:hypothetical protein VNI00_003458 [Paramarasmius palmivorus]|uniref:FAD-binding PCMH-type domain-containing protein n=1 Tax=Paramarasmius palmivorus TaxID=297713 RepID=A0AAW0DS63_9AGAR